MNNFDTQMDNLIEEWWESFQSDFDYYQQGLNRTDADDDEAIEFLNEWAWEQNIKFQLALYVMTTHSEQIDWDFFGDIYCGGEEAVRDQAIWLILKYHLIPRAEQKWAKPPEPKVKELNNPTCDGKMVEIDGKKYKLQLIEE